MHECSTVPRARQAAILPVRAGKEPRGARGVPSHVPSCKINLLHLATDTRSGLFCPWRSRSFECRNLIESEALQVGDKVFKVTCQGKEFL